MPNKDMGLKKKNRGMSGYMGGGMSGDRNNSMMMPKAPMSAMYRKGGKLSYNRGGGTEMGKETKSYKEYVKKMFGGGPTSKKKDQLVYIAMRKKERPIPKTTKGNGANYRSTKSGAGMTKKGVAAYRKANPGSKLKTAVTGKVKKGSKAAKRRKSYCARSAGQLKNSSAKTRNDPDSRIRQARKRWKC